MNSDQVVIRVLLLISCLSLLMIVLLASARWFLGFLIIFMGLLSPVCVTEVSENSEFAFLRVWPCECSFP